jgi:hypothetical protein
VALCALLASRSIVVGSVEGRWVYPYVSSLGGGAFVAALAGAAAAAALAAGSLRLARLRPASAVALLVAGGTLLQLLLWRISPFTLGAIVRSDAATSYFSAALRADAATLLRRWEMIAPTLPLHAVGNMPGKVLLFRAMHAVGASPDAMAVTILVLGNLVGALVFLVALELLEDRAAAVAAMALWVLLPSRLVFAPILNGVAALPVVLALWLWIRFLRGGGTALAAATGGALFAALLLDPTPLGLGLVFVGAAIVAWREGRVSPARAALGSVLCAATVVACVLAFQALTGFDTFRQLARVAVEAQRFNEWTGRPYLAWLVANPGEFAITLGAPVLVAVAWGLWRSRAALASPPAWMALAGIASVAAVDLLGRNRGEVTRLWVFLAVPLVVSAGGFLSRAGRAALPVAAAALAFQGATMLAVLGFVIP